MAQACCQPVTLQSSTEQWGLPFALNTAAVRCCRVTAELHEKQHFLGLIAMTQDCCQPVSHSSTEQWGIKLALNKAAVHGVRSLQTCIKSKSS